MKTVYGQFINLDWEVEAPYEFVRGHVTWPEFIAAVRDEMICRYGEFHATWFRVETLRHMYGRWSCDSRIEYDHYLEEYNTPGKGRFPITRVLYRGI